MKFPPRQTGWYARRRSESAHPGAWDGWALGIRPSMGNQGLRLIDWSGKGDHGTPTGYGASDPMYVAGRDGLALSFDGTDDDVTVTSPSFNPTGAPFTFAATIRPDSVITNDRRLFHVSNAANNAGQIGVDIAGTLGAGVIRVGIAHASATLIRETTSGILTAGVFTRVVVTWDGTTAAANCRIYAAGVEAGYATTTNGAGAASDASGLWCFGERKHLADRNFIGTMDDVRIYNRALSAAEVMQDYLGLYDPLRLRERRTAYSIPSSIKPWLYTYPQPIIGGGIAA